MSRGKMNAHTPNPPRPMDRDEVIRKIQALLARANHPTANEHEASVCADKVQQLLLTYNLEMAEVEAEAASENRAEVIEASIKMGVGARDSYEWCLDIARAIAYATFTRHLVHPTSRSLIFIGRPTEVEVARELYAFLSEQIARLALEEVYGLPLPDPKGELWNKTIVLHGFEVTVPIGWNPAKQKKYRGADTYKFTRGFLYGCGARVRERLIEQARTAREQHTQADQVTALVAVKDGLIRNYMAERYPRLTTLAGSKRPDAGVAEGYQAGNRVQLNRRTPIAAG